MFGTFASAAVRRSHACGPFDLGQDWKQADTNEIYRIVRQGTGEQCWELQYLDTGEGAAVTNTDELHLYLSDSGNDESGTGEEGAPFLTWDRAVEEISSYTHIGVLRVTLGDGYTLAPTEPLPAGAIDAIVFDGSGKNTLATVTLAAGSTSQLVANATMSASPEGAGYQDCFVEVLAGVNTGAYRMLRGYHQYPDAACATTAHISLSGEQTIDGVLTSNSLVLVKNHNDPLGNGLYRTSSGTWTRAGMANSGGSTVGAQCTVTGGSVNAGLTFRMSALYASGQTWTTGDYTLVPTAPFGAAFSAGNTVRVFRPSATIDVSGITGTGQAVLGPTPVTLVNVEIDGGAFWCEGPVSTALVRCAPESGVYSDGADHGAVFSFVDRITPILGADWRGSGIVIDYAVLDTPRLTSGYINARYGAASATSLEHAQLLGGRMGGAVSLVGGGYVRVASNASTPLVFQDGVTVAYGSTLTASGAHLQAHNETTAYRVHTSGTLVISGPMRGGALEYGVDARGGGRASVYTDSLFDLPRGHIADARVNASTQNWAFFAADGDTISDTDGSVIQRGTDGDNTGGAVVDLQEAYDNGETIELDDARGLHVTYAGNAELDAVWVVDFDNDLTTIAAPSGADAVAESGDGEDGDELLVTSGAGGAGAESEDLPEATGGNGGDSLDVRITTGPGGVGGAGSESLGTNGGGAGGNSGSLHLDVGPAGEGGAGGAGDSGDDGTAGEINIGKVNAVAINSGNSTPWHHSGMLRTVPVTTSHVANVFGIDGSAGNDFFLTLEANSTLTFSNMTAGQSGHIFANNNGGSWTLGFPTGASVQRRVGETLGQVGTGWTIYAYSVRTTNVVYVALASDGGWENNA